MGHIRLGQLPRTRKWRDVVELIAAGADVPQVANATIKSAGDAFSLVKDERMARYEEFKGNYPLLTVDEVSSIVEVELPT